jgi:hypothetical protein
MDAVNELTDEQIAVCLISLRQSLENEQSITARIRIGKTLDALEHKNKSRSDVNPAPDLTDAVNHPQHYTEHPSGIECIQITEHMGFNLGNAIKYIWRSDLKNDAIEDLRKAAWYINREIQKRENA